MPDYDTTAVDATAGPGTTAVLHGMLSTLTEVLDGLDRRLAGMEAAMEGMRVDTLADRVARLEEHLDDRLAEVAGGRERTAEALAAIGSGVGHLAARLDQLAEVDDEPEPEVEPEPDRIGPVAEAVDRLTVAVDTVLARVEALPDAAEVGRVEAAVETVLGRVEALPATVETVVASRTDALPGPADIARVEAAVEAVLARLDALPGPDPARDTELVARVEALVDGLADRLAHEVERRVAEQVAVLRHERDEAEAASAQGLRAVLDRLGEMAVSVDAVGFGLAGLTDALRSGDDTEEPDVAAVVTAEAERVRATVAELGRALAAVQAEAAAVAHRPVEVNVDVDLDRVTALLEAHGAAVREEVTRLDTLLRGQVAEVAGRAGSITDVVGRLDGRLHEVVDGVRALRRRSQEPARLTAVGGE